jgi:hypothetical protein
VRWSAFASLFAVLLAVPSVAVAAEADKHEPAEDSSAVDSTAVEKGAYGAFGVGAVAFAGSMAAGIYALHLRLGLEQVCQPRSNCPLAAQANIDEMNSAALASTIIGVVGLGAMATGTILILVSKKQAADKRAAEEATIVPLIGPTAVGLRLRF